MRFAPHQLDFKPSCLDNRTAAAPPAHTEKMESLFLSSFRPFCLFFCPVLRAFV